MISAASASLILFDGSQPSAPQLEDSKILDVSSLRYRLGDVRLRDNCDRFSSVVVRGDDERARPFMP